MRRGGAAGPALGGQRRDPARAARGQPARPADLRPLPAHLRGAAGGARRADRRGGGPADGARPRAPAGRGVARALPRAGEQRDAAVGGRPGAAGRAGGACTSATRSRTRSPVRESRAVVNRARLRHGPALEVDTPVDVLRLACALSDGDVTLASRRSFRSLRRAERRALLAALDAVVGPGKLADVNRYAEPFKRLGERLHPHEYPRWPPAQDVFAVARGERAARSLAGRAEVALAAGDVDGAVDVLATAPGMLVRAVDRLAARGRRAERARGRACASRRARRLDARAAVAARAPAQPRAARRRRALFVNQQSRAWVDGRRAPAAVRGHRGRARGGARRRAGRRLPASSAARRRPGGARRSRVPLTAKGRPDGLGDRCRAARSSR